ncbi:MAG: hypothetical protein IJA23_06700 [Clostridia bacterium]|nr:hypothetical protein [Clostridia bacterium]
MKKQIWLWTVKIAAILLWAVMLFIPEMYASVEDINVVSLREVKTEKTTGSLKFFEIEFTDKVVKGEIMLSFLNEDGDVIFEKREKFSKNDSNVATIKIKSGHYAETAEYKIRNARVKSPVVNILSILNLFTSTLMLGLVLAVIRIDYEEKVIDGKTVGVYSGLIKHRVKIDGEKVFEGKWFTLFKGREVLLNASESKDVNVLFSAMNKIDFEVIDKPAKEEIKEEVKEEPKTEEKKPQKKKTTSAPKAGAKKVVSGASKKAKFQVKSTSKKQSNKK